MEEKILLLHVNFLLAYKLIKYNIINIMYIMTFYRISLYRKIQNIVVSYILKVSVQTNLWNH